MLTPNPLPWLAIAALLSLLSSAGLLFVGQTSPQLAAHVAFALGMLPLILGAMCYFVPVLTRSSSAGGIVWWLPLLALAGGAISAIAFAIDFSAIKLSIAAAFGAVAATGLGGWALNRTRQMFGPRHRGLDWYLAALVFLVLALLAVLIMPLQPEQRALLRLFHLHANLLGFVGLTALGTLQVLLPTCLGQPDAGAAIRLRLDLKWAVAGTALVSIGAPSSLSSTMPLLGPILSGLGAGLYGWVVLRMLNAWRCRFGNDLISIDGAAPSLVAAALGLLGMVILGFAHGMGWLPARPAVAGFVVAFLLPLVSGAAAHLLPVWFHPGKQDSWHHGLRTRLSRWGGVRGLLLVCAGLATTMIF